MKVVSKKVRESARGQDCTVRLIGICNFNPETTVLAHLPCGQKGMGMKGFDTVAIHGFEGLYAITSDGQVLSAKKGWKPLRPGIKPGGYQFVGLYSGQKAKPSYRMIHRLVAEAFIPNPESKDEVNHLDGNKLNNQAANLEWSTRSENAAHGFANGLIPSGASSYQSKLSPAQALEVLSAEGSYKTLAAEYGVSAQTICNIKRGKTYKLELAEVSK